MKEKLALITGATAGIGSACAELLAKQGCDLIITGRREQRLKESAERWMSEYGVKVQTLTFDITKRAETERALSQVSSDLQRLDILINNAGLAAGVDPMQTANVDDWELMVDTNVMGLLYVTRFCLPFMMERKQGDIVNIGSVAGRWTYPGGGVYCATKFAVRALTEGLRLDLLGQPIRVTNIEPGMVETEFSLVRLKDADKAKRLYQGLTPLSAFDIAETVLWCLQRPKHVNIQELLIFPTDQAGVGPGYTARK